MERLYKIPIMGKVLNDFPLTGDKDNPLCSIPLAKIARQQGIRGIRSYECLNYNVDEGWVEVRLEADEEAHNWVADILPRLKQIADDMGYKLDKIELIRRRAERLKATEAV